MSRILPGADGRTDYLDGLLKPALRAEVDLVDAELLDAGDSGLPGIPMSLYIGGAVFNNTLVQLIRCQARGPLSDSWMVHAAGRLHTKHGQSFAAVPYNRVSTGLQDKVRFTLDEAIAKVKSL